MFRNSLLLHLLKFTKMKKITLHVYNNGIKAQIADFKNNSIEAIKCMVALNDNNIFCSNKFPVDVFYYLDYTLNNQQRKVYVDYTISKESTNVEYELYAQNVTFLISKVKP